MLPSHRLELNEKTPRDRESVDWGRGGGPTAGGEGVGEEASREVYHEAYLFMMPTAKRLSSFREGTYNDQGEKMDGALEEASDILRPEAGSVEFHQSSIHSCSKHLFSTPCTLDA